MRLDCTASKFSSKLPLRAVSCELDLIETARIQLGSIKAERIGVTPLMTGQMHVVVVSLRRRIHAQKGGTPPPPSFPVLHLAPRHLRPTGPSAPTISSIPIHLLRRTCSHYSPSLFSGLRESRLRALGPGRVGIASEVRNLRCGL